VHRAQAIVWAAGLGVVLGCGQSDSGVQPGPQPLAAITQPELGWHIGGEKAERAPISLTASDGSGLTLVSVEARAVIEDPLAFTELHLKFHNPEPRRREGRFEIALPPGAAVSRFAMRIDDEYQEGEVVERRRAQAVYEDFLHRKQDPALLEHDAGNEFAARVFPIEPNADKELIISYSQELERRDTPYALFVQGLPRLQTLDVEVRGGAAAASGAAASRDGRATEFQLSLHERDYVPAANLEVRLPRQKPVALRSGELVVARVVPVIELPAAAVSGLTVLFDTSASRALGFGAQIERLGALLEELQRQEKSPIDVRVIAFDQLAEEVFRGPVNEFGLRAKAKLLARDALGASDLGAALSFAANNSDGHARMLLVGDGVITAGIEDSTRLREAVARLAAHGVRRFDVLAEGGITDRETLALLSRAGLAETGVVLEARSAVSELANRLRKATRDRILVNLAGATWVYPEVLEGVQSGDERLIFAELPVDAPVQIELVGAAAEAYDTIEVPRPLLERAAARAKIESLTRALRALPADADSERSRSEQEIVKLSVEHRVVSELTAMLVLEGPSDYARFGLSQTALTSILRVSGRGLEVWDRRETPVLQIARDSEDGWGRPGPATGTEESDGIGGMARRRGGAEGSGAVAAARAALPVPTSAAAPPAAARSVPVPASPEKKESSRPAASGGRLGDDLDRAAKAQPAAANANQPRGEAQGALAKSADSFGSGADPGASAARERRSLDRNEMAREAEAPSVEKGSSAPAAAEPNAPADVAKAGGAALAPPAEIATGVLEPRLDLALRASRSVPESEVQRALRGAVTVRARQCFAGSPSTSLRERVRFDLSISDKGSVSDVYITGGSISDRAAQRCVLQSLRLARFPKPEGGRGSVQIELGWSMQPVAPKLAAAVSQPSGARSAVKIPSPTLADAYAGALADVLAMLRRGDTGGALAKASAAHAEDPADVTSLVALGEALEAQRDFARAARAYGSLIDLFPSRADLRRMAAERLERLPSEGLSLAVDSYRRAAQQRPDQPSGPRALAYALLKQSDRAQAFETLERALERGYDASRFDGVQRILLEDLGLVGAAWVRVDPSAESRVRASLAAHGAELAKVPSTRFVLQWETDANDVDFHIYDGQGGHAYYMRPRLGSGGSLYADITTGYGPECFAIPGKARAYPYVLQAHYFARGPMGYGMGRVQVIEHDGKGDVRVAEYPFMIMKDKAFVELARLTGPLK
jgi:hypothetical protein